MEIAEDMLKVLGRIVTILPLLLVLTLYMGKRSIGELPVFDLLVLLVLGSVVGADIADPDIDHVHTVVAMLMIVFLQKIIIWIKLKNRKAGKLLTFEPTVVIYQGELIEKNISNINYSIDNILGMMREKGAFLVSDVELAIVEANGMLSVKKNAGQEPVTRMDEGVQYRGGGYEVPVILDGVIESKALVELNHTEEWLRQSLHHLGVHDTQQVFYAAITDQGQISVTIKGRIIDSFPPIQH
ncbi:DUF421 domain-containing protein [Halobacillus litoralis]|uniref:DUF421 domain-containing protein n=1 Tax=Halobacillus litoralis TaxID=45668 RepID=UPI001CD657BD|nr:YetF domain-containing protein [Halobacillus litoralis]MCA0971275.1 DUF421 domain-containing protein [Halobacillus litoralis]